MRSGITFAAKTAFEQRLHKRLSLAKAHSTHKQNQRRWRRVSMLLASTYFATFYLHTANQIVIGGTLIIAIGCAYGAGLNEFGRIVPEADVDETI